jgi:excisionase family DNA binding protein
VSGPEKLITADAVADLVGMTKDWVYAETRAGRIPYVPCGRYYRYRPSSIAEWLAEVERGNGANNGNRGGAA